MPVARPFPIYSALFRKFESLFEGRTKPTPSLKILRPFQKLTLVSFCGLASCACCNFKRFYRGLAWRNKYAMEIRRRDHEFAVHRTFRMAAIINVIKYSEFNSVGEEFAR